ncbi:MAG: hypothetical protein ACK6CT_07660 [Planctomycetia bacterium]|jgi:hypothetical protein
MVTGGSGRIADVFRLEEPLGRRAYAEIGCTLMALKYLVEAAVIWLATDRFYQPLDFLNPLLSVRGKYFDPPAPGWLGWAVVVWSLPFLCIATTMSVRRAVDAGLGPWPGLWMFAPGINFLIMIVLCLSPKRPWPVVRSPEEATRGVDPIRSMLAGMALGSTFGLAMLALSVYGLRDYGAGLFMGTPLVVAAIAAYVDNRSARRSLGRSLVVAQAALLLCGGFLILLAFEGIVCLVMLYPIAGAMGIVGGLVGHAIARLGPDRPATIVAPLVMLPLLMGAERLVRTVPTYEVRTAIEIDATPEAVWPHVVGFSTLTAPPAWYFRLGIAYPLRATIDGSGVGAVRRCEFSTGPFIEPITAWEPGRRLAFDVASQPPPMHELSPYRHIHPPHLDGYLRCRRGEFRLITIPGGRTRLEGSTWYEYEIYPQAYWTLWSDMLIQRIHRRVLDHIRRESERPPETAPGP